MNVVFISPHFPAQYHRFCLELRNLGVNTLGIADAPYDDLPHGVKHSLTAYYRVDNIEDYDELLRACGYFTHRYGRIDRIDSLNEYWLATEARLRDDFNMEGIRGHEVTAIRRKSEMKEKFREAGIPVAEGRVAASLEEARQVIRETGYPVVAKPDAGVGALDTYRLDTDADLVRFFKVKPAVDYILEAFINGTIYSFDGLTDAEGTPVFWTSHVFSQGIMETVNEGRHIHYYSLRRIPESLEAAGRRCLKAFKVRERFFHIEFFKTGPDRFTALEVNMRPPGGYTTDMFNYACDIDVYRMWALVLAQGRPELSFERKYHCCYTSRKNTLSYVHDHGSIMDRYGHVMCQVDRVPGVFSSALGDMGYIFRTKTLDEMNEVVHFIQETHPLEGGR
jgi:hypothetical protein